MSRPVPWRRRDLLTCSLVTALLKRAALPLHASSSSAHAALTCSHLWQKQQVARPVSTNSDSTSVVSSPLEDFLRLGLAGFGQAPPLFQDEVQMCFVSCYFCLQLLREV